MSKLKTCAIENKSLPSILVLKAGIVGLLSRGSLNSIYYVVTTSSPADKKYGSTLPTN